MMPTVRLALLLAALAIGGCSRTTFENAPLDTGKCDPALVGRWEGEDDPSEFQAELDTACKLRVRSTTGHGTHEIDIGELQSGRIGEDDYLWFNATRMNLALEIGAMPRDRASDVYVLRYRVSGNTLTLRQPDHKRIAHLVVDGQGRGDVQLTDNGSNFDLVNHVHGDRADIRKLIEKHAPFDSGQEAVLLRREPTGRGP
ncbi:MAG TPA: hypothetical protein VGD21_10095 [Lysobacter sp.]